MIKRLFDISAALLASVVAVPVVAVAAVGVKMSSRGPVLYRATRVGRDGRPFTIVKIRTMRVASPGSSAITAAGDERVFAFGRLLRSCKIDELPQLWNVVKGDMAIVGPRPEDVGIVDAHYAPEHRRTLDVRPGLSSPGSVWGTTHGEQMIGTEDPVGDYVAKVLAVKLALDLHYVEHCSLGTDLRVIGRTLGLVAAQLSRRTATIREPPEFADAMRYHLYPPR